MFVAKGMDFQSIFFQKISWNWIVYFFKLETDVYDVPWSLLGTKKIIILILILPCVLAYKILLDRRSLEKVQLAFISKYFLISSSFIGLYAIYQIIFNANITLAALYYLLPLLFTTQFLSLVFFESQISAKNLRHIALALLFTNIAKFDPIYEILLVCFCFLVVNMQKKVKQKALSKYSRTRVSLIAPVVVMLLNLIPNLDVKNTSENFSTCLLSINCSISDSKAKVANRFQDWYISKYTKNEQFYVYTIPDTDLEEDLVFRVLATGVFSFTYLPNLEGLEFEELTYIDFEKYLAGRKNVVILSGSVNSLDELRDRFLLRDSRFKVSSVDKMQDRDVIIYVSRIGI